MGLETVDATGKVRPMVDILTDLKNATDGMAETTKRRTCCTAFLENGHIRLSWD